MSVNPQPNAGDLNLNRMVFPAPPGSRKLKDFTFENKEGNFEPETDQTDVDIEFEKGTTISKGIFAGLVVFDDKEKTIPFNGIREKELKLMRKLYQNLKNNLGPIKILDSGSFDKETQNLVEKTKDNINQMKDELISADPDDVAQLTKTIAGSEKFLLDLSNTKKEDYSNFKAKVMDAFKKIMRHPAGRELLLKVQEEKDTEFIFCLKKNQSGSSPYLDSKKKYIAIGLEDHEIFEVVLAPNGKRELVLFPFDVLIYHELCHCVRAPENLLPTMHPKWCTHFTSLEEYDVITGSRTNLKALFLALIGKVDDKNNDTEPTEEFNPSEKRKILDFYLEVNIKQLFLTDKDVQQLKSDIMQVGFKIEELTKDLISKYSEWRYSTGLRDGIPNYPRVTHVGVRLPPEYFNSDGSLRRDIKTPIDDPKMDDCLQSLIGLNINIDRIKELDTKIDWDKPINEEGQTPLMIAVLNNNEEVVKFLLNKKPPLVLMKDDKDGNTVLHCAANSPSLALMVLNVCLDRGIDVNILNKKNYSPFSNNLQNIQKIGGILIDLEKSQEQNSAYYKELIETVKGLIMLSQTIINTSKTEKVYQAANGTILFMKQINAITTILLGLNSDVSFAAFTDLFKLIADNIPPDDREKIMTRAFFEIWQTENEGASRILDVAKLMMSNGANILAVDEQGETILQQIARRINVAEVSIRESEKQIKAKKNISNASENIPQQNRIITQLKRFQRCIGSLDKTSVKNAAGPDAMREVKKP